MSEPGHPRSGDGQPLVHLPGVPPFLKSWLQNGPYRRPALWLTIATALMAVALALPHISASYLRTVYALPEEPPRSAYDFVALVYDGPGGPDAVPLERFREHLAALRDAGYHFIGLQDVHDLLRAGRPLPRRAVLVTIDGCAPSAWNAWRRALLHARARAVLFVDNESQRRPSLHALRYAVMTPHWEVGVAYEQWPPSPSSRVSTASESNPVMAPSETARRYHRLLAIQQAVMARHHRLRSRMRRPFPTPIMALASPAAPQGEDPVMIDYRCAMTAETALDLFDLGFRTSGLSLNNRRTPPRRLNRLRVEPGWSGKALVDRLQAEQSAEFIFSDRLGSRERGVWTPVLGTPTFEGQTLTLRATPAAPVTALWLVGSDGVTEFSSEMEFSLTGGVLRFVFLGNPDESRRWEVQLGADGLARVVRVESGAETEIARGTYVPSATPQRFHLVVRGEQMLARVDGTNLFGGSGWIAFDETPQPGRIGLRFSRSAAVEAQARISSLRVGPEESVIAVCKPSPGTVPYALHWAVQHASEISAISPPLSQLRSTASPVLGIAPNRLYRLAARIHRWRLLPHVDLHTQGDFAAWTRDRWKEQLEGVDADGVLVRVEEASAVGPDLPGWSRQAAATLAALGMQLLIRVPDALQKQIAEGRLWADISGVQWVVAAETAPVSGRNPLAVEKVLSAVEVEDDLRRYYEMLSAPRESEADARHARVRRWRDEAEEAFSAGNYERAVSLWFDWHEAEPDQAFPLRRIGDALLRIGYRDEALDFYEQSLERDPGNVALAVQTAELLTALGKKSQASRLLGQYAAIFPKNDLVLLAQARAWRGQRRLEESLALIRRALDINPDSVAAALLLMELSPEPDERRAAAARLARLCEDPTRRLEVLRAIYESGVLTRYEAHALTELVETLGSKDGPQDPALMAWLALLRPRAQAVSETLQGVPLSAAWRLDGATAKTESTRVVVQADPDREEFSLRLIGSERWRDCFLEVELDEAIGEYWLTARRSPAQLVRFGVGPAQEQMFLQNWSRMEDQMGLRRYLVAPWKGRTAGLKLRLEVRGNAAVAYVNGRPWGPGTLSLDGDCTPGWIELVGRAMERGAARIAIRRIAAGPLYPSLAIADGEGARAPLEKLSAALRAHAAQLTGVSPEWFAVDAAGEWRGKPTDTDDFFRLFARYHGLRLLPLVRWAPGVAPRAAELADAAEIHRTDGFVLVFEEAPSLAMLRELSRHLLAYPIDVFAWVNGGGGEAARLIGLGRAELLLPGAEITGLPLTAIRSEDMLIPKEGPLPGPVLLHLNVR